MSCHVYSQVIPALQSEVKNGGKLDTCPVATGSHLLDQLIVNAKNGSAAQARWVRYVANAELKLNPLTQFSIASLTKEESPFREPCSLETSKTNTCERSTLLQWLTSPM